MNPVSNKNPQGGLVKVAAAQIESAYGDIEANLAAHLRFMAQAAAAGVQLLVFPELSLTGHSAGKDALRLAMKTDDPVLGALAKASGDMHTVIGFIEEAPGGQFHNSVATVAGGKVIHVHRKLNLATYGNLKDGLYYASGDALEDFALGNQWRVATPICADLWNPALVHELACRGTTLMAAPISSGREAVGDGFDNPAGWDLNLRFYALTYGLGVVMANRVGTEGLLSFWGGSRILDAMGTVVAMGSTTQEDLVVGELDYAAVRQARFLLPTVRDARALARRSPGGGWNSWQKNSEVS